MPTPPNVLLIDDQLSNLIALEQSLEPVGVTTFKASSGEAALGMLLEQAIDCILLDVSMPGMDGFEFLHTLRSDPEMNHIPVVMLTGKVFSENEAIRAYQYGAYDFLTKPVDSSMLSQKVGYLAFRALNHRHIRKMQSQLNRLGSDLVEPIGSVLAGMEQTDSSRAVLQKVLEAAQSLAQQWGAIQDGQ